MTSLSAVAILAERLDHGLGVPVDDRQQNAGRPVRNTASLLPLLKRTGIETEAVGPLFGWKRGEPVEIRMCTATGCGFSPVLGHCHMCDADTRIGLVVTLVSVILDITLECRPARRDQDRGHYRIGGSG